MVKNPSYFNCNMGDLGSIPGLGRYPGEGKGYPLQYSVLENSKDIVHGVAKSQTQLSDFHFHFPHQLSKTLFSGLLFHKIRHANSKMLA